MPLASVTAHWLDGWGEHPAPSPLYHGLPHHRYPERKKRKKRIPVEVYEATPIWVAPDEVWSVQKKLAVIATFEIEEE